MEERDGERVDSDRAARFVGDADSIRVRDAGEVAPELARALAAADEHGVPRDGIVEMIAEGYDASDIADRMADIARELKAGGGAETADGPPRAQSQQDEPSES